MQLVQLSKMHSISERTIRRWIKQHERFGVVGLANSIPNRSNRRVPANIKEMVEALALRTPPLSAATIYRYLKAREDILGAKIPSYTSVRRMVQSIKPSLRTLAHEGRQAYINKYDLVHRVEAESPNAIWQADHTELDVLVKFQDSYKKPWLTIILDDYSRAVAGYALSFAAPSAIQTALAFRNAIWHKARSDWEVCGIPDMLYTDHGSDFTSRHIEQVALSIKTNLIFSAVGQPRGRGKIERFFRSLQQVFLPGLPGHQPPGSKDKSKNHMELSQLAAKLEAFIVENYHAQSHSTTGMAPAEKWASNGFLPRLPESSSELDYCF